MKKIYLLLSALFTLSILAVSMHSLQAKTTFPIADLGNCRDAQECRLYCDVPANHAACWSYSKYVLHPEEVLGVSTTATTLTFPIVELGNCGSSTECKAYCEVATNHEACMAFARAHNLGRYKEDQTKLEAAKKEFGCTSREECYVYCSQEEHKTQCEAFAQTHAAPQEQAKRQEVISKAKSLLGCDSFTSCKTACENPNNQEKCTSLATQILPKEQIEKAKARLQELQKALPCDSLEACAAFCNDAVNAQTCVSFAQKVMPREFERMQMLKRTGTDKLEIRSSGNCASGEDCRSYCEQNTDSCPGFKEAQEKMRMQQTPTGATGTGLPVHPLFGKPELLQREGIKSQALKSDTEIKSLGQPYSTPATATTQPSYY